MADVLQRLSENPWFVPIFAAIWFGTIFVGMHAIQEIATKATAAWWTGRFTYDQMTRAAEMNSSLTARMAHQIGKAVQDQEKKETA